MKIVVIRCSASATVGFGHLTRCRVLASEFNKKSFSVVIVGPSETLKEKSDNDLFLKWIPKESWGEAREEALYHIGILKELNTKYIVIDDYRSNGEHQLILRNFGARILQQYDASKKQNFAANLVINGSPYEKEEFYISDCLKNDVEFLLGPEFCILRSVFLDNNIMKIKKEKKILISLGGGDDYGVVLFLLENFIKYINDWNIVVVLGLNNPNIKKIRNWIDKNPNKNVVLKINPVNMAQIMASCKFAILGGGTTIFEAARLGVPAILIPLANNQINQCIGWDKLGVMVEVSNIDNFNEKKFRYYLNLFMKDDSLVHKMSTKAKRIVDAYGVKRIVERFLINERNN